MRISEWGEQRLVEHLIRQFPPAGKGVGIGDDCAVIPMFGERVELATCDALVEGVHFQIDTISPEDLGYKAIAVNVSDIAAMGGRPRHALLSIALPPDTKRAWLEGVSLGVQEACDQFEVRLVGGDTVGSRGGIFLSVTLIGEAEESEVKFRDTAVAGDVVCVTGDLGDSSAGLRVLKHSVAQSPVIDHLIQAHVRPRIYLEEGVWLAKQEGVHAMMDISDGLDCDLKRLIRASKLGAAVEVGKLPLSLVLREVSASYGWDALQLALNGGEDYVLLLTVSESRFDAIQELYTARFATPLFPIGRITDCINQLTYDSAFANLVPYDHFACGTDEERV